MNSNYYNNPYSNFNEDRESLRLYDVSRDAYYAAKEYYTNIYSDNENYYDY